MAKIQEKVLHSVKPCPEEKDPAFQNMPLVNIMFKIIQEELESSGDRVFLQEFICASQGEGKGQFVNLSSLEPQAKKVASALRKLGFGPGDVAQIVLENCVDYYYMVLGVWIVGGCVSLSNPDLLTDTVIQQIRQSRSSVVFCYPKHVELFREQLTSVRFVVLPGNPSEWSECDRAVTWSQFLSSGQCNDPATEGLAKSGDDDPAIILWSSGTTGNPKGIVHGRTYFLNTLQKTPLDKGTGIILQTTCFYHSGGFVLPFNGGLYNNMQVVFLNPNQDISPSDIFRACHEHKPSFIIAGSHHAMQMASSFEKHPDLDLSSVTLLYPMGAKVPYTIIPQLNKHFPELKFFCGLYGMTELGSISIATNPSSLGHLEYGVQVQIVDPESGQKLGPNEIGEIQAKTLTRMIGYLDMPEENAKFFTDDGFGRTGDLGFYDEDGVLFYSDRMKEVIKHRNNFVHPGELEDILLRHPCIEDAVVFGRPEPSVQEEVCAVVVLKADRGKRTEVVIQEFVNSKVDSFKKISGGLKIVDKLPRNTQGKILRAELHKLFD